MDPDDVNKLDITDEQGRKIDGFPKDGNGTIDLRRQPFQDRVPEGSNNTPIVESKEKLDGAALEVSVNKEVLAELVEEFPQFRDMLERFKQLPDRLKFGAGVNMIFGENGSGKSTLAKTIYLLAKIDQLTAWNQKGFAPIEDYNEARAEAVKSVLDPESGDGHMAFLLGSGLSKVLALRQAFRIESLNSEDLPEFWSIQNMMGELHGARAKVMERDRRRDRTIFDKETAGSSRQTIELLLNNYLAARSNSVLFMDEVDLGLSANRQEEFIPELMQLAEERGLIVLAPGNSGFAYEQPYPRIDLDDSSKGVHIPDEKPEWLSEASMRLVSRERQEGDGEFGFGMRINKQVLETLAVKHPEFKDMIERFMKLPDELRFNKGATLIFGANASGKSTLAKAIYLALQVEATSQRLKESRKRKRYITQEDLSLDPMKMVMDPHSLGEELFIKEAGLAAELVMSRAIELEVPELPKLSTWDSFNPVKFFDALQIAGLLTDDVNGMLFYGATAKQVEESGRGQSRSTRQTIEAELERIVEQSEPGTIIVIDELEGGMSPAGQIIRLPRFLDMIRERRITVIAPSNSYHGYKYGIGDRIDLQKPEHGIFTIVRNSV